MARCPDPCGPARERSPGKPLNHFSTARILRERVRRLTPIEPIEPSHITQVAAGSQFTIYDGDVVLTVTVECKEGCDCD